MFLYSGQFSLEEKKSNYDYYEPRCIHESSLSPSIHSIIASEIGKPEEAYKFFEFATRLDLDNYNRNTREGLHTTSIAAAWMNIVYGFGGMRSDGEKLVFNPSIPERWGKYSFPISFKGTQLIVDVDKENATFRAVSGDDVDIAVYGHHYRVGSSAIKVNLQEIKVG
ncbi:Maltose phosphorylase [compost metagenome]